MVIVSDGSASVPMLPLDAVWQQWVVECAVSGQWPGLGRYQAGNLLHCPTWSSLAPTPSTPRHSYTPPPLHPARSNSYTTAGRGGYSAWNIFKKVQYLLWKSINLSSFTESCSMFDMSNRTVCTPSHLYSIPPPDWQPGAGCWIWALGALVQ